MVEFDENTYRRIVSYFGRDPRVPKEVTDTVYDEYGDETWTLSGFQQAIAEAAAKIPEALRASATVELSGGHDEVTRLTISYQRLQTPEEVARDVERGLAYARERDADDRAKYEALKRKFEG